MSLAPADQPKDRPGPAAIGADVAGALALDVGDQHRPSRDPGAPPIGLTVAPHAAATQITAPATPPAPPAPGGQPFVEPVPDQLVRVLMPLRGAADGEYTMSLQLRPAEFGDVTVLVSVRDGVLSVALRGSDTAANHALQDALPDLHHQLRSDGIRVGDLGLLPLTPAVAAQPGQHAGQSGQQFQPSGNQPALQLGQPDRQGQQGQSGQHGQPGSQFGGNGHPDQRRSGTAEAGISGSSHNPVQPGRRDTGHSVLRRTAGTAVLDVDI